MMRAAGLAVLCSGTTLLGQASLSAYFSGSGRLAGFSGDGSTAVLSFFAGGSGTGGPSENCVIYYSDGTTMGLYPSNGTASTYALNFDGTVAWGTNAAGGGNVRKVTGTTAATQTTYFPGQAWDVSDDEHAVVGRTGNRAFVWNPSTSPTPLLLQPLSGGTTSYGDSVSPDGQFVLGRSNNPFRTTRWAAVGGWTPMAVPMPAGFTSMTAGQVSNTGLLVGSASGAAPNTGRDYPFVWNYSGNPRMLPIAGQEGYAMAISGDGSVIVGYETTAAQTSLVVWRNGFREDVAALLNAAGVSTAGYRFDSASQVSTDGSVIGAMGQDPGNGRVYCRITLPPPCVPDVGIAGGLPGKDGALDNNDFIAFINCFFASDLRADLGIAGGARGADGVFDNNDFIAFINAFFAGC